MVSATLNLRYLHNLHCVTLALFINVLIIIIIIIIITHVTWVTTHLSTTEGRKAESAIARTLNEPEIGRNYVKTQISDYVVAISSTQWEIRLVLSAWYDVRQSGTWVQCS